MRAWLAGWVRDVPDLTVVLCPFLCSLPETKHPFGMVLFTQLAFSNVVFQIEHPDKAHDPVAPQIAGVEGALKVYEAILTQHSDARLEYYDDLLAKREKATLQEHLKDLVKDKCL